ncbi:uncharacterized protein LOC105700257 [Orussus abietinus]|uniref:uncharacterized protein LOC105700257 n=1 Tax=Orussus abietinus TaxID=222816 RepID=UPI00062633A4|nr:uncharacterized protein LOC105700257 [Orussus abietinus]
MRRTGAPSVFWAIALISFPGILGSEVDRRIKVGCEGSLDASGCSQVPARVPVIPTGHLGLTKGKRERNDALESRDFRGGTPSRRTAERTDSPNKGSVGLKDRRDKSGASSAETAAFPNTEVATDPIPSVSSSPPRSTTSSTEIPPDAHGAEYPGRTPEPPTFEEHEILPVLDKFFEFGGEFFLGKIKLELKRQLMETGLLDALSEKFKILLEMADGDVNAATDKMRSQLKESLNRPSTREKMRKLLFKFGRRLDVTDF